jgi:four helix bundle protein
VRDHTKLRAFHVADELSVKVYEETRSFPAEERFELSAQLRSSALSVPSNIVEGCARHSETEFIRFLDIAYGSARELEYQLTLASRLGFLSAESTLPGKSTELSKILNGLIRSFRPQVAP